MPNTRYFYQILVKLEFSREIFKQKFSNIKFHENPPSGGRVILFYAEKRRTDTHDDAKYRFFAIFLNSLKLLTLGHFESEDGNLNPLSL